MDNRSFPDLLTCPNCGGKANFITEHVGYRGDPHLAISCETCGFEMISPHAAEREGLQYYPLDDFNYLARTWNRRRPVLSKEE